MLKPSENKCVEKLHTIPETCNLMGIREHALRRAVSSGLVPYYTPFGTRRYVRVSEAKPNSLRISASRETRVQIRYHDCT